MVETVSVVDHASQTGQQDAFNKYGRPLTLALIIILGFVLTAYSLYSAYLSDSER